MATKLPAFLVYRCLPRSDPSIRRHIEGKTRHAVTRAGPLLFDAAGNRLGVELLAEPMPENTLRRLRREFDKATKGKPGKPPSCYGEYLFNAEPRVGGRWSPDDARRWAKECVAWFRERNPDCPIVCAAVHLDERSYHVHILAHVRGRDDDGQWRYGISAARKAVDADLTGRPRGTLAPTSKKATQAAASRLQDDVWQRLGKPYGLRRGEKGSKRRHKSLTDAGRAKAAAEEALELQAQADERMKQAQAKEKEVERKAQRIDIKWRTRQLDKREKAQDVREEAQDVRDEAQDERERGLARREEEIEAEAAAALRRLRAAQHHLDQLMRRLFAATKKAMAKAGISPRRYFEPDFAEAVQRGTPPGSELADRGKAIEQLLAEQDRETRGARQSGNGKVAPIQRNGMGR